LQGARGDVGPIGPKGEIGETGFGTKIYYPCSQFSFIIINTLLARILCGIKLCHLKLMTNPSVLKRLKVSFALRLKG